MQEPQLGDKEEEASVGEIMHTLYRHYDKHGNLLYVGVTNNIESRNIAHKYSSPWFNNVTEIRERCFGSRRSALKEELREIKRDTPCFNSKGNIKTEGYDEMAKQVSPKRKKKRNEKLYVILYGKDHVPSRTSLWIWELMNQPYHYG